MHTSKGVWVRRSAALMVHGWLVMASFCTFAQSGERMDVSMGSLLATERFRANAMVYRNQRRINPAMAAHVQWNNQQMTVTYRTDTVSWEIADLDGNRYLINFPNDVTLYYGKDQKQLKDELLVSIRQASSPHVMFMHSEHPGGEITTVTQGSRYDMLHMESFMGKDGLRICDPHAPAQSLINAFQDTTSCDGIYPIQIRVHGYQSIDSVVSSVASLLKATRAVNWQKWSAIDGEEVTLLLQHPFLSADHLLFARMMSRKDIQGWVIDFYPYVPSGNVKDLFGQYSRKKTKQTVKLHE